MPGVRGGGLGDSGNARKKTFFSIDVFPKCACTRFDSIDDDNGDDSDYDDGDGKDDGDDDDVKDDNEGVRLVAGLARI